MKTTKHPKELSDAEAAKIVDAFDTASNEDYVVTGADARAQNCGPRRPSDKKPTAESRQLR